MSEYSTIIIVTIIIFITLGLNVYCVVFSVHLNAITTSAIGISV